MSNSGYNDIVVEGIVAKDLYEKISQIIDKCTEFNTRYELGVLNGETYEIEKQNEQDITSYVVYVWNESEDNTQYYPYCLSFIKSSDIKYKNGRLTLHEEWCQCMGAVERFIRTTELESCTINGIIKKRNISK